MYIQKAILFFIFPRKKTAKRKGPKEKYSPFQKKVKIYLDKSKNILYINDMITVREMIRLLESKGFREIRSKGSHFRYTDGKGHYVTIPAGHGMKTVLKPGVEKSIRRQAGL